MLLCPWLTGGRSPHTLCTRKSALDRSEERINANDLKISSFFV